MGAEIGRRCKQELISFLLRIYHTASTRQTAQAKAAAPKPPQKGGTLGDTITFLVEPVPKGRPRFHIQNGHVMTFTPRKTRTFESDIANIYVNQHGRFYEKGTALELTVVFYMPIPKSVSKTMRNNMIKDFVKHTKKSDLDNLIKALLDALNGIAYADDAQIVKLSARKQYAETPRIELNISIAGGGT